MAVMELEEEEEAADRVFIEDVQEGV